MNGYFRIAFPYLLFTAMAALVVWSNVRGGPGAATATAETTHDPGSATGEAADGGSGRLIDPVCGMDVNAAWGFAHVHERKTYHFCAEQCRVAFAADPFDYLRTRCLVCQTPVDPGAGVPATYLGQTYSLCSEDHRREFKVEPASFFMHRMWGIPDWMYYTSIAAVLLVSFLAFEGLAAFQRRRRTGHRNQTTDPEARNSGLGTRASELDSAWDEPSGAIAIPVAGLWRSALSEASALSLPVLQPEAPVARPRTRQPGDRVDLLGLRPVRALLLSRPFRFGVQLAIVAAFLLIIAAGLFGNQNPALNIAPLLTWTVWWGGLVVLIMFAGKAWCYMCPWDAIAMWMERLRFWRKSDAGMGLGLRWPRIVRNIAIATILFVGLTWVELGFGVTMRPAATAYIAIAMLVMAIVSAFLFDRKSFCRYGCLVGRVSGLYAMFAGVEVRPRSRGTCRSCRTKECVTGSETAYGCPTFEYVGRMETNTYCIQCGECLQACPHDNLAVNLRPWGADLAVEGKPRTDEAYLALLMLALSGFHGLTMTPVWAQMTGALEAALPLGRIAAFTLGMFGLMAVPVTIYTALVWLSYRITTGSDAEARQRTSYHAYFVRYAYCVLPIALFYHLAHNLEHLLMEGPKVIALLSDPFGWGWNLLGTAGWTVPPMVSLDVLWILQVVLVGVGHVYSLWVAQRISRRTFADDVAASRGQWPILAGMIAFSVFSLWLLKQPMEMRTSAM